MIIKRGRMPDEWRKNIIVPIYKGKGDPQECKNHRGIKLLPHVLKLWERGIDARLRELVEIHERQISFRTGKGTTDAIFILRQLMKKHREGGKNMGPVKCRRY